MILTLPKRPSASILLTFNELLTSQYIYSQSIIPYLSCSPADHVFIISYVSPKYYLNKLFSSSKGFPGSPNIIYLPSFTSVPILFSCKVFLPLLIFLFHSLLLIPFLLFVSLFYRIRFVQARGYPASIITSLLLSLPLGCFQQIKFIFDPRSLYFLERKATPLNYSLNRYYEKLILNRANTIFSVSHGMHNYFRTRFDSSSCFYVPLVFSPPDLNQTKSLSNLNFESSLIICGNYLVQDCSLCISYAVQLIKQSLSTTKPLTLSIIVPDPILFRKRYYDFILYFCKIYDVPIHLISILSLSRDQVCHAYRSAFYGIHLLPKMEDSFTRLGIKSVEMMSSSLPIIFNQYVGELNLLKDQHRCNHFVDFKSASSVICSNELDVLLNIRSTLVSNCSVAAAQYSSYKCFPTLSSIYENI